MALKYAYGLWVWWLLCGIIFVAQTSSAAKSGYQMHDLENQVAGLQTEIHKMEVDITDYSSMGSIQNRLKDSRHGGGGQN